MKYIKLFFIAAVLSFSSCETLDLEQTENPSVVSQDLLDPVFTFNYVQLQLPNFINSANGFTQEVTRQMAMTGGNTYDNAYAPVNFNTNWSDGYNILNAIKVMEPKALANNEFYILGASKVIRCYILLTMTDMYGDIPVSEALLGNENLTPRFDKSADVYKQILTELDDAIAMLEQTGGSSTTITDLYYGGKASWVTLAKTLKLKMYNNARLAESDLGVDIAASINAIINGGDYIDSPEKDFAFRYGNSRNTPNTRHPLYNDQYELNGGSYIGNYLPWAMTTEKGFSAAFNTVPSGNDDPRLNFYFYRQAPNPATYANDAFTLPRPQRPPHFDDFEYTSFYDSAIKTPYTISNFTGTSFPANGFWGRDHGNNDGIPPDGSLRTVGGLYPIGGAYGPGSDVQKSGTNGALGAGIMPMVMSSFVHFIKAEAILTVPGVSGDAKAEFKLGMEQSINKVINFAPDYIPKTPEVAPPSLTALQAQRDRYVTFMLGKYDALSSVDDHLEIVEKEYYIAAWGNGIEPYNNYRRTGFPSNFQPTREPNPGAFYYTAYYPGNSVNNNPNAPSNVRTRKVFWDKANLDLH